MVTNHVCFLVYCKEWIDLVNNTMNVLQRSKDLAEDYKAKLAAEEQMSRVSKK